jgi:hypothetical protein
MFSFLSQQLNLVQGAGVVLRRLYPFTSPAVPILSE